MALTAGLSSIRCDGGIADIGFLSPYGHVDRQRRANASQQSGRTRCRAVGQRPKTAAARGRRRAASNGDLKELASPIAISRVLEGNIRDQPQARNFPNRIHGTGSIGRGPDCGRLPKELATVGPMGDVQIKISKRNSSTSREGDSKSRLIPLRGSVKGRRVPSKALPGAIAIYGVRSRARAPGATSGTGPGVYVEHQLGGHMKSRGGHMNVLCRCFVTIAGLALALFAADIG